MRRPYVQLSAGAVASKLLGALREIFLARFFGTGLVADAYRSGLTVTLSPAHFLTAQVVDTCFVPLYARYRTDQPERAWALYQGLLLATIALGVLIALALLLCAGPLVALLLPGFGPERREMTVALLRIMALGVPPYLYSALLSALGAAQKDFVIPSLRPGLQNLGMLAMILAGAALKRPALIAYGFTGTYALLALWGTLHLLRRDRMPRRWVLVPAMLAPLLGELWRVFRPLVLVALLVEANLLLERFLASLIAPGTVAAMDYARFVTESTHALLILPLGMISLTHFAALDEQAVERQARRMLGVVLIVFIPLSVFLLVNARALLALLFLRGAFDRDSLEASRQALLGLSTGLWAFGASHLLRCILNARTRNRRVLAGETTAVALNVAVNLALFRPLGILALGLGPSIGALGSLIIYGRGLKVLNAGGSYGRLLGWTTLYAGVALLLHRWVSDFTGLALQLLWAGLYGLFWLKRIRSGLN
jgi:putative peptidoglycan lipid II flippase